MIDNQYFRFFLFIIILCFPAFANLFKSVGSGTLVLFSLFGLSVCFLPKFRPEVTRTEKILFICFIGFIIAYLISGTVNFLTGELEEFRGKHFEKEVYLSFFVLVYLFLKQQKLPQWPIWYAITSGGTIVGIYALMNSGWVGEVERVRAAYNPIMFGGLSLTLGFMSLQGIRYFKEKHKLLVILPVTGFVSGTTASFLTGSRGAWIAIPALMIITLWNLSFYLKKWMITAFIILIVIFSVFAYKIPETGIERRIKAAVADFKRYSKGEITLDGGVGLRLESWKASWKIFTKRPVLGTGPGGYFYEVQKMVKNGELSHNVEIYYTQPHSIYMAVLAETGLLGFVFLMLIFLVPLIIFLSRIKQGTPGKEASFAGIVLIIGYMHFGLTETIFGRNLFVSFYVIMLSILLIVSEKATFRKDEMPLP